MRIDCPACDAIYEVPQDRLAAGQLVRCARCGNDWMPLPAAPALEPRPEPPLPVAPEPAPLPAQPTSPAVIPLPAPTLERSEAPRSRVTAVSIAWALSVLVLLAALWGMYAGRAAIMQAWPPSVRAYAALGLSK